MKTSLKKYQEWELSLDTSMTWEKSKVIIGIPIEIKSEISGL